MINRGRAEIICRVLDAARDGASLTRISYRAYLSYAQTCTHLSELAENGLVEMHGKTFKTTPKGLEVMRLYGLIDIFSAVGKKS
jgi:predicted transcriptional regulator